MARTKCRGDPSRTILANGKRYGDLVVKILLYDFNSRIVECDNDKSTFESQFMQHGTNDEAEVLTPQTAHILISEFKKTMTVLAKGFLACNQAFTGTYKMLILNGKTVYIFLNSGLPIYIERVWNYMVEHHHDVYVRFCKTLVNGYIHKVQIKRGFYYLFHPNAPHFGFEIIKQLQGIYVNQKCEFDERTYEVEVTNEELDMLNTIIESEIDQYDSYSEIDLPNIIKSIDLAKSVLKQSDHVITNSMFDIHILDENAEKLFERLISVEIPKGILKKFQSMYSLSHKQGLLVMIEYMKLLAIHHLYPHRNLTVPGLLYRFYIHHKSDTFHFLSFCKNAFSDENFQLKLPVGLNPKLLNCKAKHTLSEYKRVIGSDPPYYIWHCLISKGESESNPNKILFHSCVYESDQLIKVNIFRLFCIRLYHRHISKKLRLKGLKSAEIRKQKGKRLKLEDTVDIGDYHSSLRENAAIYYFTNYSKLNLTQVNRK